MPANRPCAWSSSSARLTLSTNRDQSNHEMRRMLVMTFRTVTFIAACRWCSMRTVSSAVVPCAASTSSSQPSAGVAAGSWSRSRWKSWTRPAVGSVTSESRRREAAAASGLCRPMPSRLSANSSARCRAFRLRTICRARRRRFSTRMIRMLIATAHSSPMVSGSTSWYAPTILRRLSGSNRLSVWAT